MRTTPHLLKSGCLGITSQQARSQQVQLLWVGHPGGDLQCINTHARAQTVTVQCTASGTYSQGLEDSLRVNELASACHAVARPAAAPCTVHQGPMCTKWWSLLVDRAPSRHSQQHTQRQDTLCPGPLI